MIYNIKIILLSIHIAHIYFKTKSNFQIARGVDNETKPSVVVQGKVYLLLETLKRNHGDLLNYIW